MATTKLKRRKRNLEKLFTNLSIYLPYNEKKKREKTINKEYQINIDIHKEHFNNYSMILTLPPFLYKTKFQNSVSPLAFPSDYQSIL